MAKNGSFYTNSRFYPIEFPHGLSRSGEFIQFQAELLELHGKAYQALHAGLREPANEEEARFLEVCRGERSAITDHEKAWERFCLKTRKKPSVSPFGLSSRNATSEHSEQSVLIEDFVDE